MSRQVGVPGVTPVADPRAAPVAGPRQRRLRHEARDELAAAAVSLIGSVVTTVALWALLRWLA